MAIKYAITYSSDRKIKQTIRFDTDSEVNILDVNHEVSTGLVYEARKKSPQYVALKKTDNLSAWNALKTKYGIDPSDDHCLTEIEYEALSNSDVKTYVEMYPGEESYFKYSPKQKHIICVEFIDHQSNSSKASGEAL